MPRFVLSPFAIEDVADIKEYLTTAAGIPVARTVIRAFRTAFLFLARTLGAGHLREDLTQRSVKFWSVYSYLIIYNPAKQPVEIVRVIHGNRDIAAILDRDD